MRNIRLAFAALLALFVFSLSARATTISETVQNDGSQLFGTITFDGTSFAGSFTFFDGTTSYVFDATTSSQSNSSPVGANYNITELMNSNGDILELGGLEGLPSVPGDTVLCSTANPCSNADTSPFVSQFTSAGGAGPFDIDGGDVLVVTSGGTATTPEPSSLVLLGTGVLSFAGAARRRFVKR